MRRSGGYPGASSPRIVLRTLAAALSLSASAGLAQTTGKAAADPIVSPPQTRVGDIVVTAQKREERLQDVPIVVTVARRQLLQDADIRTIGDLAKLVPGMIVTTTDSEVDTAIRLRGIGTVGFNPGLEPDVGIFIDGVYRPRTGVGFGDLGDLDRIEVLEGPQGTLFGKSTTAGVVNVTTRLPSFTPRAEAEIGGGDYGAIGGSGEVSGPLAGDTLAGSLYLADRARDGFYSVRTGMGPRTRRDDDNENLRTLRGQLLYQPNAGTRLRLIGDYSRHRESCCVATLYAAGAALDAQGDTAQSIVTALGGTGGGEPSVAHPFDRIAYANRASPQRITDGGVSLQLDQDLSAIGAKLTSISAWRYWRIVSGNDLDFSNADLIVAPGGGANGQRYRTFNQEVRISGTAGRLDYTLGGFYERERIGYANALRYGGQYDAYLDAAVGSIGFGAPVPGLLTTLFGPTAVHPAGDGTADRYSEHDDSYALFTNETLHLTDRWQLTGGLRFTIDDKSLASHYANLGGGAACAAVVASPLTQAGIVPTSLISTLCLPSESPAFNALDDYQAETEHALTGTIKSAYRFSPALLAYASYARGYKAGGFNLDRLGCPTQPGCPADTVTADLNTRFRRTAADSFELGLKSTLLDRSLTLNLTGFYETIRNLQLNTFTGVVFVVDTVPTVHSRGIEANFAWQPTRALALQGGVTIADTRFVHRDLPVLLDDGYLGKPGARVQLAPLASTSLSATYTVGLPGGSTLRLYAGTKFNSRYSTDTDEDPRKEQKAYALTDARVAFATPGGRYGIDLWVENAFDTHYVQETFDSPIQNLPDNATGVVDAFLGAPRTIGVTFRARY